MVQEGSSSETVIGQTDWQLWYRWSGRLTNQIRGVAGATSTHSGSHAPNKGSDKVNSWNARTDSAWPQDGGVEFYYLVAKPPGAAIFNNTRE